MDNLFQKAEKAKDYVLSQCSINAEFALVLGTGLGVLVDEVIINKKISYESIPFFPKSTVEGHAGELVIGKLGDVEVVILSGRFHYYEGYEPEELGFPIRVLKLLGIDSIIFTNVSGALNPHFNPGDFVFISDHINLLPTNPLRGKNDTRFGIRFPDLKEVYDQSAIEQGLTYCKTNGINAWKGIYICIQGPSLETPAECRLFRKMGADIIGMSTVPEVIVAKHMEMKVIALSLVSNKNFPTYEMKETTIEEVIQIAKDGEQKLNSILKVLVS